ncbi:MAG: hypothetical protein KAW02_02440 [candidate division Zixibacteria bacterium]|nr:hypothetical protein [candidate division Zixibacteria bacterium]
MKISTENPLYLTGLFTHHPVQFKQVGRINLKSILKLIQNKAFGFILKDI